MLLQRSIACRICPLSISDSAPFPDLLQRYLVLRRRGEISQTKLLAIRIPPLSQQLIAPRGGGFDTQLRKTDQLPGWSL